MFSLGRKLKFWILVIISFVVSNYIGVACSQDGNQLQPSPLASAPIEPPYCTTVGSFGDFVTLTGKAVFNIRESTPNGLGGEISGPNGGAIRYAEVQVADANGTLITCGETDSNGTYSLSVPRNQNLTVSVKSRSANNHVNVSVLDSPISNTPYSLRQSVSTSGVSSGAIVSAPLMTASAKGDVMGGAFNILFNILRANESLRFLICSNNSVDTGCPAFSVAPKVTVFWSKGVNPYSYFGRSDALSFYSVGTDQLFILGGVNGDTDNSDTDHFDDAVISHEYGHFMEDHYGHSDSPGGGHNGDSILDARLMWSEGWADFFSSLVRGDKMYRDTVGNSDGKGVNPTFCLFDYDIEKNSDSAHGSLDLPHDANWNGNPATATVAGVGNFREFAITRALWDIVDPFKITPGGPLVGNNGNNPPSIISDDNKNDITTSDFGLTIWKVFTQFHDPNTHFRSIGRFLASDITLDNSLAIDHQVLDFQGIIASAKDYGATLAPSVSACPIGITANDEVGGFNFGTNSPLNCSMGDRTVFCSNQFSSNDFYDINQDGTISSISLEVIGGAGAANGEIDIYLLAEKYTFGNISDIKAQGPIGILPRKKTMSLAGLPNGHYMLNVSVYTKNGNPGPINYQLYYQFSNGEKMVCPQ